MSLLLRPCDWISSLHTSVHHLHSLGSIPTYTILFRDWVSNREPCGSLSSDESTRTRHQTNLAMRTGPHTHAAYDYYCMHCCVNCSDKCNCGLQYLPSQPPCQPGRTPMQSVNLCPSPSVAYKKKICFFHFRNRSSRRREQNPSVNTIVLQIQFALPLDQNGARFAAEQSLWKKL